MKYTFLLPVFEPQDIDHTIMSIIRQDCRDFELVVLDDCSPYDWPQLLEPYMAEGHITCQRTTRNIGDEDPVALWNQCLQYAQGEYVILCDGTHLYAPEFLTELDALIEKYPAVNVFGCRKNIINGSSSLVDLDGQLSEYSIRPDFACRLFGSVIYSSIANYILRREPLMAQGGYIPFPTGKYTGDATILALCESGIVFSPQLLFSLRINSYSNNSTPDPDVCDRELQAAIDFYYWNKEHIHPTLLTDKSPITLLFLHRYGHCLIDYLKRKIGMSVRHHRRHTLRVLNRHRGRPPFITRRWILFLAIYWLHDHIKTRLILRFTKRKLNVYDEERLITIEW